MTRVCGVSLTAVRRRLTRYQAALEASTAKVSELTAQLQAASAAAEDVKALRQRAQLVEEELADANTKLEVQLKVGKMCSLNVELVVTRGVITAS